MTPSKASPALGDTPSQAPSFFPAVAVQASRPPRARDEGARGRGRGWPRDREEVIAMT